VPDDLPYSEMARAAIRKAVLEMKDAAQARNREFNKAMDAGDALGKLVIALNEGAINREALAAGLDHTTDRAYREGAVELAKLLLEWALEARHESLLHQALHSLMVWGVKF
jgi:hypothetical protein